VPPNPFHGADANPLAPPCRDVPERRTAESAGHVSPNRITIQVCQTADSAVRNSDPNRPKTKIRREKSFAQRGQLSTGIKPRLRAWEKIDLFAKRPASGGEIAVPCPDAQNSCRVALALLIPPAAPNRLGELAFV
jgi:hypothetical protein